MASTISGTFYVSPSTTSTGGGGGGTSGGGGGGSTGGSGTSSECAYLQSELSAAQAYLNNLYANQASIEASVGGGTLGAEYFQNQVTEQQNYIASLQQQLAGC